ncbi:MAG: membrane protease YdiL (CAAX protease family) [Myxococcota bacterium]|jgi:membrane protease YdiL (CAAX protease family)
MSTPPPPQTEREFIGSAVGFYAFMGAVAALWMWLRGEPIGRLLTPGTPLGGDDPAIWLQILVGVGFGLVVAWVSQKMSQHLEFARKLSQEIRLMLPELSLGGVAVAAVTSSVGEELLFRGAMQDHLGFWVTAIIFAIVHGFFDRRYLAWMGFAGLMGLAFGLMTLWMGTLVAPVLAHFTVNFINLNHLVQTPDESQPT